MREKWIEQQLVKAVKDIGGIALKIVSPDIFNIGIEQEHQGDQVDKTAGQVGAGHLVASLFSAKS